MVHMNLGRRFIMSEIRQETFDQTMMSILDKWCNCSRLIYSILCKHDRYTVTWGRSCMPWAERGVLSYVGLSSLDALGVVSLTASGASGDDMFTVCMNACTCIYHVFLWYSRVCTPLHCIDMHCLWLYVYIDISYTCHEGRRLRWLRCGCRLHWGLS